MRDLKKLNRFFWKYKWRLSLGTAFIIISNYFGILAPQVTGFVVDQVSVLLSGSASAKATATDPMLKWLFSSFEFAASDVYAFVFFCGGLLLALALLRGFFMFLMRQTIIVMSRLIEYDQKNEVYAHYQQLDLMFYKVNSTGDLMSRISEDVSRVRMYTGPALMYLINLIVLISISLYYMLAKNALLSIYVLSPLPFLAIAMYFVNTYINRKSERIQEQLSDLTTHAQESYSGIRVIKSFAQEHASLRFFDEQSEAYRKSGLVLSALEAIYFPSIALLIGLSTLLTIYIGSRFQLNHTVSAGTIAEFVVYINMLTFPVSAIGWVASNIQRAAASQKRINAFLDTQPDIQSPANALPIPHIDSIQFDAVSYRYPHTGIRALHELSFRLERGQKMAIIGKTGSGKTTIAQLLIRLMDPDSGTIHINGIPATHINLRDLRSRISIVPQDVFLFSDSIENNIAFGDAQSNHETATEMARDAFILDDINSLPLGMNTTIGERGVTLSGGQKQRISIARALSKEYDLLILDDCLSAVDARTESAIAANLNRILKNKTTIVITHRPIPSIHFDWVLELEGGLSLSIKKSN